MLIEPLWRPDTGHPRALTYLTFTRSLRGGLYPFCLQVGNWGSERVSNLPIWSHSLYTEEMGLKNRSFQHPSIYFQKHSRAHSLVSPEHYHSSSLEGNIRSFKKQIWHDFTSSGQLLCLIAMSVGEMKTKKKKKQKRIDNYSLKANQMSIKC